MVKNDHNIYDDNNNNNNNNNSNSNSNIKNQSRLYSLQNECSTCLKGTFLRTSGFLRVGSLIALSSCRVLLIYNFTVSLGQKLITYRCPRMGTVGSLSIKTRIMTIKNNGY